MRSAWHIARSVFLWFFSGVFFFTAAPLLVFLELFFDPLKHDWPQRALCRAIVFLSGARVRTKCAPGFDPRCTSFFIVNHVNLFDPFILYCAIPQIIRGWELESHFKIPAYGWLMGRFGNVPVPDVPRPSAMKRMLRLTRESLDRGVSLVVFPEGSRTRDGRVGPFEEGVFRAAIQLGAPIVPVSLVGSFAHHRTGNWMLYPATISVHLHDTIESKGMKKEEARMLCERVRSIVAAPLEAARTKQ
jgi:1-acyl-sn-glycerol-3-phosphate acyltransferase